VKCRQNSERGTSRLRMVVAFIAGMAITAALAQTPVAADIFSPRSIHQPVVPAPLAAPDSPKAGDSLDPSHPVKPCLSELVYAIFEEAGLPC
jgi:hypothetical protein